MTFADSPSFTSKQGALLYLSQGKLLYLSQGKLLYLSRGGHSNGVERFGNSSSWRGANIYNDKVFSLLFSASCSSGFMSSLGLRNFQFLLVPSNLFLSECGRFKIQISKNEHWYLLPFIEGVCWMESGRGKKWRICAPRPEEFLACSLAGYFALIKIRRWKLFWVSCRNALMPISGI